MNIAYEPQEFNSFGGGMNTVDEADKIKDDECVYAQNIDLSSAGAIGPRKGRTLFGNNTSGNGEILGAAVAIRRDGTQIPLRVRDTVLEWYESSDESWNTLATGLTDNLKYGFANYVTSTYDRIYIGNGVDTNQKWNTATTVLTADVATIDTIINVTSTTGFDNSGSIIIEGDTITYTGKTSTTFTGCGSIATAHASGKGVAQIPASASSVEKGNILFVKDWRLTVAGTPTKEPTMTMSSANNPEDFTESSPRVVGDPTIEDFPEGGGAITSIHEHDKWWIIFKEDTIRLFTLDISTDAGGAGGDAEVPITKAVITAPGLGAINHYGTTGGDNDVFYVSRNGGLRSLTQVLQADSSSLKMVDLTDIIRPTVKNYNFENAASIFFDKKIFVACKRSDESVTNDIVIVYDLRTGGIVVYTGWNVSCWFIYERNLYFGSATDPNTYRAFDGYVDYYREDTETAVTSVWRSKRFNFGKASKQKEADLVYIEGLISPDTNLEVMIRYDEEGSRTSVTKNIMGTGSYVVQTPVNMLGINELGDEPFSGTIEDVNDLGKFRVYLTMPNTSSFYNADIQITSEVVGARWKITNLAVNPIIQGEPPAHLKL